MPKADNKLQFSIFTQDLNNKISEIQIISNGATIIKRINDLNLKRIKYLYKHEPKENETWYVIKIILADGKIAISSPIFRE